MGIIEVLTPIANGVTGYFNGLDEPYKTASVVLIHVVVIVIYALFVFKFYKFLGAREVIKLNLKKYNLSVHPGVSKFFAIILYTLEYLVILPFLVIFWYGFFSLFLFILAESSAAQTLLLSAAIIATIRITSYITEDLSRDIAKMLPFTVLGIYLVNPNFIKINLIFDKFMQIPDLLNNILIFLAIIFIIEFVLRGVYSIVQLMKSGDSVDNKEDEEEEE
ncbi:hypothetical protein GOV12_03370 [Candidatus Pacearchaeota archaeon]|nr:hypothetical protein [Candidatus Pacearchaeota archaeon]